MDVFLQEKPLNFITRESINNLNFLESVKNTDFYLKKEFLLVLIILSN